MCIYTLNSKNFFKKMSTPPNVPKLGVSGVKDTPKTNNDNEIFLFNIIIDHRN